MVGPGRVEIEVVVNRLIILMQRQSSPLVLVYYRVRGKLQPIRNLIAYLELAAIEVHLENEEERRCLPAEVVNCLRGLRIDKSQLPLLVFQKLVIYDIYPIMAFLSRRFGQQCLLGRDIRQKARLQQILQIFFIRQPNSMAEMFKLAEFAATHDGDILLEEKKHYYEKYIKESMYLKEICDYLESNGGGFVFGTPTLVDFLFLESCHYMLGMFNRLDQKQECPITHELLDIFGDCPPDSLKYLKTMRNFLSFMYNQPFYQRNQSFLQSFTLIFDNFSSQRIIGLKKLWAFNPKFIQI